MLCAKFNVKLVTLDLYTTKQTIKFSLIQPSENIQTETNTFCMINI